MDIFSIIILISKWITLTVVSFCVYLVWIFVVNPWNQQRKYRKYKNVYVPERLNAPSGDLIEMEEKVANGKFRFQYLTDFDPTKYDIRLGHLGPHTHFQLISHRAHEEVNKLIPAVVDRHTAKFGVQFGPLIKDTLGLKRSTKMFKNKRQVFLKILGFNYSSKYISTMINVVKEKIATWQEGQEVNALLEMGNVALRIIVQITFGKDADSKMPELSYTNPDGSTSLMNFYEFFPKLMADLLKAEFYPLNVVFPFLFLNGWLYPNNINKKNMLELRSKMSSFMDTIEDKDSVYKQLVDNHKFKKEDIFDDIIGLVHAAHQTSHHTVCTVLFNIKKHPQWLEKIQKELEDAGLTTGCDIEAKLTRDVIHESANLACVVKEALRFDPAGNLSLAYKAYKDTKICGVPIPKGSKLMVSVSSTHYNKEQFPDPYKFKPERFDPQSDCFYIGGSKGKARHPLSYIPFSFSERKCPGMIFALMEVKTIICYFLQRVEYSIDPNLLKDDKIRYGIFTNFQLGLKIEKIK